MLTLIIVYAINKQSAKSTKLFREGGREKSAPMITVRYPDTNDGLLFLLTINYRIFIL